MKKISFLILILLILSISLFGCSKMVIEDTIKKFQDAVNKDDVDALKNVMSPDSDFYITNTVNYLVGSSSSYFYDFTPVHYYNLDINLDSNYADVYADATYKGVEVTGGVLFKMKKEETLLSFIFPDWKVYQYYDNGDFKNAVWRKIKKLNSQ